MGWWVPEGPLMGPDSDYLTSSSMATAAEGAVEALAGCRYLQQYWGKNIMTERLAGAGRYNTSWTCSALMNIFLVYQFCVKGRINIDKVQL